MAAMHMSYSLFVGKMLQKGMQTFRLKMSEKNCLILWNVVYAVYEHSEELNRKFDRSYILFHFQIKIPTYT